MVQCILQSKIVFLGMENYEWTYIKIKGRGITISDLTRKEAQEIILGQKLTRCPNVDPHLGWVYEDKKFKEYVNSHPKTKKKLIAIIDTLDNA